VLSHKSPGFGDLSGGMFDTRWSFCSSGDDDWAGYITARKVSVRYFSRISWNQDRKSTRELNEPITRVTCNNLFKELGLC
jgi:hypothetical protein